MDAPKGMPQPDPYHVPMHDPHAHRPSPPSTHVHFYQTADTERSRTRDMTIRRGEAAGLVRGRCRRGKFGSETDAIKEAADASCRGDAPSCVIGRGALNLASFSGESFGGAGGSTTRCPRRTGG